MSQKKRHLASRYNAKHPKCIVINNWRMERVEWFLTKDPNQVTCISCLNLKNKINHSAGLPRDILEEARLKLLKANVGPIH